jgi:hypothetical protein
MLPDSEPCRKNILAYKQRIYREGPNIMTFPLFWEYKSGCEKNGQSILDETNLPLTARKMHALLAFLNRQKNAVATAGEIEQVLKSIRSEYLEIHQVKLGDGQIKPHRQALESIYQKLNNINNDNEAKNPSIVGKSSLLMAVWGQIPRFDSYNRTRFERWTHTPGPERLPHLKSNLIWYKPEEFAEIVEELDRWVMKWPESNAGNNFTESFYDLCPGIPAGRQIDIIYHWKMPDPRVDYRLASRGS